MTDYTTTTLVKLSIEKTAADDDTLLDTLVTAASRAIDRVCNRPENFFVADSVASAREFPGTGTAVQPIPHCIEITAVAVKDAVTDSAYTSWASADWVAASGSPKAPDFNSLPYTMLIVDPTGDQTVFTNGEYSMRSGFQRTRRRLQRAQVLPTVQVTAKWGYAETVPSDIQMAATITASRWYQRGKATWGDTLANVDMGQLFYTKELDPDVKLILERGRRIRPTVGGRR